MSSVFHVPALLRRLRPTSLVCGVGIVAVLVSGASHSTRPRHPASAPPPQLIAEASILPHGGDEHIFLPITVHGHAVTALLDLGTSGNLLSKQFMANPKSPYELHDSLTFGTETLRNVTMVDEPGTMNWIGKIVLPAGWPPVGALLGMEIQSHYDIVLDMPAHKVRFYSRPPVTDTSHSPAWLPSGLSAADCLLMTRRPDQTPGMVDMPVTVNGHPTYGHFDSGAKPNYIHIIEGRQLGLADSTARHAGGDDGTYVWQGLTLQIGRQTIRPQQARVAFFRPAQDDSLQFNFGLDAFRDRVLFVSYSTGHVCLGPAALPRQHRRAIR